jgi:hypothetical protein
MKDDAKLMTLPQIKRMLRLRWLSMFSSILFTSLTVAFSFGKQVMHSPWAGSFLVAGAFGALTLACCVGYLVLNKKLAGSGL